MSRITSGLSKTLERILVGPNWHVGEKFFEAITAAPVPVDMRVLKAIKRSPLSLRMGDVARVQAVKTRFYSLGWTAATDGRGIHQCERLCAKGEVVYPALSVSYTKGGMMLYPSRTAIAHPDSSPDPS